MDMEKLKTIAVNAAAIALISLALIWGNTLYRQHVQFEKGQKALAAGDFTAAVAGFEAAIHMYTPASGIVRQSAQKLFALGEAAERQGEWQRALIAYRALRSSFYAVEWLYTPGQEWIERSEARIDELVKRQQG